LENPQRKSRNGGVIRIGSCGGTANSAKGREASPGLSSEKVRELPGITSFSGIFVTYETLVTNILVDII
jgi:hypothetical protein